MNGALRRALRTHARPAVAILCLWAVGIAAAIVILSNQRLLLPGWVPVLGTETFQLEAELETAQAVTPGQGQTVNVSGVPIGEVSSVDLRDGRAIVGMRIRAEHASVLREDATLLLRPRTGLKDMILDMDPGSPSRPPLAEGATIPEARTAPDVNADEILASLDRDTQHFLRLLLAGGAEGLEGQGRDLASTFKRFEPLARETREIASELAARRRNTARAIHSLRLLGEELARRDADLVRFVESSDAALGAFAASEASIRATLRELPSALQATERALADTDAMAVELGPALRDMRPFAVALGPALRGLRPMFRETVEPLRAQIRPFARSALRPLDRLRPAARDLGAAVPRLASSFGNLNRLTNILAFNPRGSEQGYLFWLAWANHNVNSLFLTQDAQGPLRRGMVMVTCQTALAIDGVRHDDALIATLTQLADVPTVGEVCPPEVAEQAEREGTAGSSARVSHGGADQDGSEADGDDPEAGER